MSSEVSRLRSEAAVYSGGTAADTSVSAVRWQQDEQTVAGLVFSFSVFAPIFTSPIFRWFKPLAVEPSCPGLR